MATNIEEVIPEIDEDKIPIEGQQSLIFRQNAGYVWGKLREIVLSFNIFKEELNIVAGEINTSASQVANDKEYISESRTVVEQTMATMPVGTINNITSSDTSTYSSSHIDTILETEVDLLEQEIDSINEKIDNLRTPTPILSGDTTKGEGLILTLTITNPSSTAIYDINVDAGSYIFNYPYIHWTMPIFSGVDDEHNISVVAREEGFLPSIPALYTVTVLDLGDGGTIDYQGVTMSEITFPDRTNVNVIDNKLVATSDGAIAISNKITDTDTIVSITPEMDSKAIGYTVEAGATTTSVTVSSATDFTIGDILLMSLDISTTLTKIDTTSITTDNGGDSYTFDLTGLGFTSAPTQVLKYVPKLSTSIVTSGGADSFVERSIVSVTADGDGIYNVVAFGNVGSNITKSNNDLTVTTTATSWEANTSYSDTSILDGNIYAEFTIDNVSSGDVFVGVSTVNTEQSTIYASTNAYFYTETGTKRNSNNATAYGASFTTGDIIGLRYSYVTGELEFYKNGVSQGIAFTLPTNTEVYFITVGRYSGIVITANYGITEFNNKPIGTSSLAYINTATEITTLFDADTREGNDVVHKIEMNNCDEVSRITTDVQIVL